MKQKAQTDDRILELVHKTAAGLYRIGVIDKVKMDEFDSLCIERPSRRAKAL